MDKETTTISANKFHALEVEWVIEMPHILQKDGSFKEISLPKVSLVSPGTTFHSRARIINLDAQTALNLLDWLCQRKETLEDLAKSKPWQIAYVGTRTNIKGVKIMQGYTLVPNSLFDTDDLSYVTQSLGMWLCFLCQQSITGEHSTNLKALEGLVGHRLTDGDMYRLAKAGIITYEHHGDAWKVKLTNNH